MKAVAIVVVVLVTVSAVIFIAGWFLPVAHIASQSATIGRPAADVFAVVSDIDGYNSWWDGYDTRVEVVEQVPPTRFVTRIADAQEFGGTWTIDLAPHGGETTVTITERGEVYNPAFRFMSRFVFGYKGTMESYLGALAKQVGR